MICIILRYAYNSVVTLNLFQGLVKRSKIQANLFQYLSHLSASELGR
jgi:hypothetical protein